MSSVAMLGYTALRMLRAVGELGSFTAAAIELGYSQPSVSNHIRRMETHVGAPVVRRVGQRYELTEVGRVIVDQSELAAEQLEIADRQIARLVGRQTGYVRLAAFRSLLVSFVPRVLAQMEEEFPGITTTLRQENPDEIEDLVTRGKVEVGAVFTYEELPSGKRYGRAYQDENGNTRIPLFKDPLFVAFPARDPRTSGERVSLKSLQEDRWITGFHREYLIKQCEAVGIRPRITHTVEDFLIARGLVAAGLGVAVFPGLTRDSVDHNDVKLRKVEPPLYRTVELVVGDTVLDQPAPSALIRTMIRAVEAEYSQ